MPILSKIFDILSGAASAVKLNVPLGSQPKPAPTPTRAAVAVERGGVTPPPSSPPAVDIDAVLTKLGNETGATDWKNSIVDLMKCFGVDATLENRIELAHELGYTGITDAEHSAEMNMWLHKELMANITKHGGELKL